MDVRHTTSKVQQCFSLRLRKLQHHNNLKSQGTVQICLTSTCRKTNKQKKRYLDQIWEDKKTEGSKRNDNPKDSFQTSRKSATPRETDGKYEQMSVTDEHTFARFQTSWARCFLHKVTFSLPSPFGSLLGLSTKRRGGGSANQCDLNRAESY